MLDYSKALQGCKVVDMNLNLGTMDRVFLASSINLDLGQQSVIGMKKQLNRNQFVESLVRCAQIKFQLPASVPTSEKKLSMAVAKLIDHLKANADVFPMKTLRETLWCNDAHTFFKKHEGKIRLVMEMQVQKNNVTEQFLTLNNILDIFCTKADTPLHEKEVQ